MNKMKKYLLCVLGVITLLGTTTSCNDGFEHSGKEELDLTRSWKLSTIYGVEADVNLFVEFSENGKFTICQLTEDYTYAVFTGSYSTSIEGENSILSGEYSDGIPWTSSYIYVVDESKRELVLESINTPAEVSVYKPASMPNTSRTQLQAQPQDQTNTTTAIVRPL